MGCPMSSQNTFRPFGAGIKKGFMHMVGAIRGDIIAWQLKRT